MKINRIKFGTGTCIRSLRKPTPCNNRSIGSVQSWWNKESPFRHATNQLIYLSILYLTSSISNFPFFCSYHLEPCTAALLNCSECRFPSLLQYLHLSKVIFCMRWAVDDGLFALCFIDFTAQNNLERRAMRTFKSRFDRIYSKRNEKLSWNSLHLRIVPITICAWDTKKLKHARQQCRD